MWMEVGLTDPERVKQQNGWIELLRDGKATLGDLLDATGRHKELDRSKPPARTKSCRAGRTSADGFRK